MKYSTMKILKKMFFTLEIMFSLIAFVNILLLRYNNISGLLLTILNVMLIFLCSVIYNHYSLEMNNKKMNYMYNKICNNHMYYKKYINSKYGMIIQKTHKK